MLARYIVQGILVCLLAMVSGHAVAGGISADAGLTPGQDKWIVRTQVRYLHRADDPSPMQRTMESFMFPAVAAYGLRPDVTLMLRQAFARMDMTMGTAGTRNSGFGDLLIMGKYRALRHNSPGYTLGLAPLLGLEVPTGKAPFTSEGWDLKTGLFFSARISSWALDLNLAYTWNGIAGGGDRVRNEVFEAVNALAYQFDVGEQSRTALAPVIELSYTNFSRDRISGVTQPASGESWVHLSPGVKFTHSSIIVESLLQVPVWQNQMGNQPELRLGGLFGIRIFM